MHLFTDPGDTCCGLHGGTPKRHARVLTPRTREGDLMRKKDLCRRHQGPCDETVPDAGQALGPGTRVPTRDWGRQRGRGRRGPLRGQDSQGFQQLQKLEGRHGTGSPSERPEGACPADTLTLDF